MLHLEAKLDDIAAAAGRMGRKDWALWVGGALLTLDRSRRGPDHPMSLETSEFAAMVAAIREVAGALTARGIYP